MDAALATLIDADLPINELQERCRCERQQYRNDNTAASPACLALFQTALRHSAAAQNAVCEIFAPLLKSWVGSQRQLDAEEVMQQAWLQFWRYAPNTPNLLRSTELGPILLYLRQCVKTTILMALRKQKREVDLDAIAEVATPDHVEEQVVHQVTLQECLARLLKTEEERLIFRWRFEWEATPQEIVAHHSAHFPNIDEVYQIIQRITRRLRSDETLQALAHKVPVARRKAPLLASLYFRLSPTSDEMHQGKGEMMEQRCAVDEQQLLDYVMGIAAADRVAQIEQSPACRQAARQLAAELEPLFALLYRLTCPTETTLVAYQERRLTGTEYLVLYRHVQECPLCQAEIALLNEVDAIPLTPAPGLLRRLVEALFVSPTQLPQAVRGTLLRYETPQVIINISTRKTIGKPRSWTLRGQLRTPEGLRYTEVEAITLQTLDLTANRTWSADYEGDSFVFKELPPGRYTLQILTPTQELVIRTLTIGDDD